VPTITFRKQDLDHLLGRSLTLNQLEQAWPLVKGELKEYNEATSELKLELNDTNRPDLWCVEGVARQVRTHLDRKLHSYPFYSGRRKAAGEVIVNPLLKSIRPYIGACIARRLKIDDAALTGLIQTQEKLGEGFGRKRRLVSIGFYRLQEINFPVSYTAVKPTEAKFIPLGFETPMTLAEILESHPKGMAYGKILSSFEAYPLLVDIDKKVLSFPPIINSRQIGEVRAGDQDLFVEVTGTDLRMVVLTVNILAANLADRGATIDPIEIRYPYSTELGQKIVMPSQLQRSLTVEVEEFSRTLGEKATLDQVVLMLTYYGYTVKAQGKRVVVSAPAFRDDLMHPVDVIEDFAISRGYGSFGPENPTQFTVGGLSAIESFSDRIRNHLIGMGYQEVISNILTHRSELTDRMNLPGNQLVEVDNVMSETYSALRNWIVPSLLRVEASSSKAFYPHRIFEVGEVAMIDMNIMEATRTLLKAGVLLAHPSANFSELHSCLDSLMYYLGKPYELQPMSHPTFIEGRVGRIRVSGDEVGLIGEVHPQVLSNWQITMPCTVFELELDGLLKMTQATT
jgi:phenylalanyl-tRNA synthetase beta chain